MEGYADRPPALDLEPQFNGVGDGGDAAGEHRLCILRVALHARRLQPDVVTGGAVLAPLLQQQPRLCRFSRLQGSGKAKAAHPWDTASRQAIVQNSCSVKVAFTHIAADLQRMVRSGVLNTQQQLSK